MAKLVSERKEEFRAIEPIECPDRDALYSRLTLIFSEAARSHIQAGDLEKATLCVVEAMLCLGSVSSENSSK